MKLHNKKLLPYFRGLTDKFRLMVYLLAIDYTFDQVRKMTVAELSDVYEDLPEELGLCDVCCELMRYDDEAKAFSTDSGRPYSRANLIDVLKRSHKIAEVEYEGLDAFVEAVSKKR